VWVTAVLVGLSLWAIPAVAVETCNVIDSSTDEVVPGVQMTWDSSFLCADAPTSGSYAISVEVINESDTTVDLNDVVLSHTTPRARRMSAGGSITGTSGLGTLAPGESTTVEVTGNYSMIETDEGLKANLHLRIRGEANGEPFKLGANVHVRGPGAEL
jgi:spore coat protein U-like protein